MSDVEIGLGTVLGDEHLTVLEGVHRAGVDIEIGIELLHRDAKAARGQKLSQARCGQSLAKGRRNTARHKDVFGVVHVAKWSQCVSRRPIQARKP
ncbi:hypothetical protein GCM10022238_28380 [Gordonia hankookensis]